MPAAPPLEGALVIDASPVGRHLLQVALRRLGLAVRSFPTVAEARAAVQPQDFAVVSVDADQRADAQLSLLQDLRRRRWEGVALYTATFLSDARMQELHRELGVKAVFMKPMSMTEVELRLRRVVPHAMRTRPPTQGLPSNWIGALAGVRQEYGAVLPVRVAELQAALDAARKAPSPATLATLSSKAHTLRGSSGTYDFVGVMELAEAVEAVAAAVALGQGVDEREAWEALDAFLLAMRETLERAPLSRSTERTIDPEEADLTLLAVSEDIDLLVELAKHAQRAHVALVSSTSLRDAARAVNRNQIDGVLVSTDLADRGADRLVRWLRSQPAFASMPVGMLMPRVQGPVRTDATLPPGAQFRVSLPVTAAGFDDALERMRGGQGARRPRVMLLDDDEDFAKALRAMLGLHGFDMIHLDGPEDVVARLELHHPDLVILDVMLPMTSGFDVCRRIREHSEWNTLPVLFVSAETSAHVRNACFRAGGDDWLAKPVVEDELMMRVRARLERFRRVRELDPISGVFTRQAFLDDLEERLLAGGKAGTHLAVGLVDLDYFTDVNAAYGFAAGDVVLANVGAMVLRFAGRQGLVGRWGPDQFIVVLDKQTRTEAELTLAGLAATVRAQQFEAPGGGRFQVSAQVAAAGTDRMGRDPDKLLAQVERRMRELKAQR